MPFTIMRSFIWQLPNLFLLKLHKICKHNIFRFYLPKHLKNYRFPLIFAQEMLFTKTIIAIIHKFASFDFDFWTVLSHFTIACMTLLYDIYFRTCFKLCIQNKLDKISIQNFSVFQPISSTIPINRTSFRLFLY